MTDKVRIAAVGDNCIDSYDQTGEAYAGGNPVNVAVYTVRLGGEASYTGVVGDDDFGAFMKKSIANKGVDVSHLKTLPGKTAVTHVEIVDGERILGDYEEGVMADFKLTPEDIEFLTSYDLVVTGIWGMIEHDLPAIRDKGVKIAFDFATCYDSEVIDIAMPYVDYAFFAWDDDETDETSDEMNGRATDQMNAEEKMKKNEEELRNFMKAMKAKGCGMIVVTRGEKGSLAYDGETFTPAGIVPCNVIDTMGAGDSFIAGFLTGTLKGLPLYECMMMGASNSSVTLGYSGAW